METEKDTYFAPPERVSDEQLAAEIEIVSRNPVMSGLLHSINGLLAIMDEHRQIVALNDSLLRLLGIEDTEEVLGLRQGEALQCIHAEDEPAGCGTTKFCSSCGAAIAIVSSLEKNEPVEKICALTANRGGREVDIALLVRSHPININKRRFLLLFLQDITRQQQRAALERTFYHDINNLLTSLLASSQLLAAENPSKHARYILQASFRLHKEISIQRCLSQSDSCTYQPMLQDITTKAVIDDLRSFFNGHPAAQNKQIKFPTTCPDVMIHTDISLLSRVLSNIIINALEATAENGFVKIRIEHEADQLSFCVWNSQEIPQEITHRIFQRNFSTKEGAGRGIGTFSMKFFGEKILGGQVSFTTSKKDGTIFKYTIPV